MARKTKIVTIEDPGRDHGKRFLLTELPSAQAERWALRALMAMARSGVEIPDDLAQAGIPGLAVLGLRAVLSMPFADADPLLEEMMLCVQAIPDPTRPQVVRNLIPDDIDEVMTRIVLRREIIELHVNFSFADVRALWQPSPPTPADNPLSSPIPM